MNQTHTRAREARQIVEIGLSRDLLEKSGLPRGFWNLQVDTFSANPESLQTCVDYIRRFDRANGIGLFINGLPGTQKTFLASYVLRCRLMYGNMVRYLALMDLADMVLTERKSMRSVALEGEIAALDSVNHPRGNTYLPTAFSQYLSIRRDAGLPTIVVSSLSCYGKNNAFAHEYGEENLRLLQRITVDVHVQMDEAKMEMLDNQRKGFLAEEAT